MTIGLLLLLSSAESLPQSIAEEIPSCLASPHGGVIPHAQLARLSLSKYPSLLLLLVLRSVIDLV